MIQSHLAGLPLDLSAALEETYQDIIDHFMREEWDDAQVDAGRFSEAVLRYLEWKSSGTFTPIDGKRKPNRSKVIAAARNAVVLAPTLRAQVPQAVELMMDFRNNRNTAHLGSIRPNKMDAACVTQNATWVVGEIIRLESDRSVQEIQAFLDQLAERHIPLVQRVGETLVVLNAALSAAEKALVLLYQNGAAVPLNTLRQWAEYSNTTQWRKLVIDRLHKDKLIHLDASGLVHLLRPGELRAQQILLASRSGAAA